MNDPLVSTDWLSGHLDQVKPVDGSWFMPAEGRSGAAEFLEAHIPGAVFFDIDALADTTVDLPHMLPSPEAFAMAVGALGLRRECLIVAYDSFGVRSAARVWWTLRAMGFENVLVLDGGLRKWRAEGRPTVSGPASPAKAEVRPAFDGGLVRDQAAMRAIVANGGAQIVDARGAARFRGEAPEPRPGLRSGHMPAACNVPFDGLLNPDGTMKSVDEIPSVFTGAGVDLDRPIVTTCGSGVTASVLALALARIGRDRAAVYDGSWSEWGALTDAPVVTGP